MSDTFLPLAKTLFPESTVEHSPLHNDTQWTNKLGAKKDGSVDSATEFRLKNKPTKPESVVPFTSCGLQFKNDQNPISHFFSEREENDDELLLFLDIIEQKALSIKSLIEREKLDTVVKLRHQIEAEFNGLRLEEIPFTFHEKIDSAIQKYLELELNKIGERYGEKCVGNNSRNGIEENDLYCLPDVEMLEELKRENCDLRDKVESLETSVRRVDMLYSMQKKENEYLTEKVVTLERQLTNDQLRHENELISTCNDCVNKKENNVKICDRTDISETVNTLFHKLGQTERKNDALKMAGEADQTTIRCLEGKITELEDNLKYSRQEVDELLQEIRELQNQAKKLDDNILERDVKIRLLNEERRRLRETVIMSEHEISMLENKLGNNDKDASKESKKEILEQLKKLEEHIKVVHKEKRKLENKYLAFKIEHEHLQESFGSFSKAKEILTPFNSCNISQDQSLLSSHSSSLSSSLAGSDNEDDEKLSSEHRHVSKVNGNKWRGEQIIKDKNELKFMKSLARKLSISQENLSKNESCVFSSFQNSSGEKFSNEADELVRKVDCLEAEKKAIKKELEIIRSNQANKGVEC
ncbi:ELKS/Rab6-interacting/CAST family member 1-like isoform X2 [Xenia sp. Carnegie-2017]|nr:ELKS/Rab6-interacting/CAST family member 1-like isoform X2 [Xenia sp. Carnegie-2017]